MSVDELEVYFKTAELPGSIKLDTGVRITNVPLFIESHIDILRTYGDKPVSHPFYERLVKVKDILSAANSDL